MRRFTLLLIAVVAMLGCGPRAEVAKEKLLAKIDSMLGEIEVKRKEVEHSVDALKEGIDGLRKAKIKAKVKQDQIQRQSDPIEQKIAQVDNSLKKLRDQLASEQPVEIGGKSYEPAELQDMANKIIQARKDLERQLVGYQNSKASLQKVIDSLERKQNDYQERLTQLEAQIAEIDSKTIALNAMKDASAAMGESEKTMAANIDDLEDKVADLWADVEGELLAEDEQWNEVAVNEQIDSVDAFIAATQESSDTLAEIDKILGDSQ